MLKQFSVKNYKNFIDEISFNFGNTKNYNYNTEVIQNNTIKTALIYGPNCAGKSNLGYAMFDITLHLVDKRQDPNQILEYLNADSDETQAYFMYIFEFGENLIRYSYRKDAVARLTYEELFIDNRKVFSYNFTTQKGDYPNLAIVGAEEINTDFKTLNLSFVRYLAFNANLDDSSPIMKLMGFVDSMLFFRSLQENSFIGYKKEVDILVDSIIRDGLENRFSHFLKDMGLHDTVESVQNIIGSKTLAVKHRNRYLPFLETSSSGMKALLLFFYWSTSFKKISFLFIDEFDAFYHNDLSRKIIEYVKKQNFQAVITTHNTSIMTNDIMRPDCLFILENGRISPLFEATERELREGHNLEKMYRSGEFENE